MSKPEFGTKRSCVGCAVRFYDLSHVPPTCPKCGVVQPPEVPRPRYPGRSSMIGARRAPWQAAPAPQADEADAAAEVVVDDVEDDEEVDADVEEIDAEIDLPEPTPD